MNWSSFFGVGPQELQWNGAVGKAVLDARNAHPPLTGEEAQMLMAFHIGLKPWAIGAMRCIAYMNVSFVLYLSGSNLKLYQQLTRHAFERNLCVVGCSSYHVSLCFNLLFTTLICYQCNCYPTVA